MLEKYREVQRLRKLLEDHWMKGLYSLLTEGLQGLGDLKPHTKEVLITYL